MEDKKSFGDYMQKKKRKGINSKTIVIKQAIGILHYRNRKCKELSLLVC